MGDEFTLEDALIILRRRLLMFVIPAVLVFVVGLGVIIALPAMYAAQGTILVESAQIPQDLVRSTVNAYAQERIQTIRQRVMTRDRLLAISDKYRMFPREEGYTDSERVALMRSRVGISLITAEGPRGGAQGDGTIAFNVSYTDPSPDVAFQVANEFMSLFLTEDVRTRTAGASDTTEFFKQETDRIGASIDALDKSIAEYKSNNADALPEHLNMHLASLERAQRDLLASETAITGLDEEVRFLETQLMGHLAGATAETGPASELARLKTELVQLRSVYRDAHPSVQAVKDQIAAIERELRPSKEVQEMQQRLAEAEVDLKRAERDLAPDAPETAALRTEVAALQKRLSDRIAQQANATGGDFLSAQLQGRIAVANNRRLLLESQRDRAKQTIAEVEARIAKTPAVERGLLALTRDRESLASQYREILEKQRSAQLAENLQDSQKAEKFSILEAAARPERSASPDRPKLAVLALFAALATGAAFAVGAELLYGTVRGRNHLTRLVDAHPIAVIPYIGDGEKRFRMPAIPRRRAAHASAAAAAAAVIATAAGAPEEPSRSVDGQGIGSL